MTREPRVAKIRKTETEPSGDQPEAQNTDMAQENPPQKLTGRDLRRARRKAKRLGLQPTDDHDAIRMLKERGIAIEADESIMDMLPNTPAQDPGDIVQLPAEAIPTAVATPQDNRGFLDETARAVEIAKIQKQLVKRRRRRLALLFLKLAFFVALPTFLVGHYYYNTASEMFETKSEFVIQNLSRLRAVRLAGSSPAPDLRQV